MLFGYYIVFYDIFFFLFGFFDDKGVMFNGVDENKFIFEEGVVILSVDEI